jgi:hypothetical protein
MGQQKREFVTLSKCQKVRGVSLLDGHGLATCLQPLTSELADRLQHPIAGASIAGSFLLQQTRLD